MHCKKSLSLSPETDAIFQLSSEKKAIHDSFRGQASLLRSVETGDLSVPKGRIWLTFDQPPVQLLHHLIEPSRSHKSPLACGPLWRPKSILILLLLCLQILAYNDGRICWFCVRKITIIPSHVYIHRLIHVTMSPITRTLALLYIMFK